ncbi:MAG: FAD-dependent oxidoreductase, partial [Clostridia bacterium]|nr:FAD-dependent oxidoreductase [Clostridia bacterium]
IDGFTLGYNMQKGAERFGCETMQTEVVAAKLSGEIKEIGTADGTFFAKAVIIATGADHKHLGLPEEEALTGKGVGYCATCDGMFYRGKTVMVIGGGNSAAGDAAYLSNICKKVILVHRRDTLRAEKFYADALKKAENIEFMWDSTLSQILSDGKVTGAVVKNVKDDTLSEVKVDGIFISIGRTPNTALFRDELSLDEDGYIIADESTKTTVSGVFAAGDVRQKPFRQIVTAVSDGANASHSLEEYLLGR